MGCECSRASTSVCAKNFPFCTSKTYFFYFTHLFLQNTHISLFIIHIYSNKIFIFLTLWIIVRGERKEKRVRWREERKKRIKKSFTRWTVTVYIYTVIVHLQDHCVYLDIFTKIDVEDFWVKMCKIEHFLYFRRLSMGAEDQNSYVLGLGLMGVQISKYWILILIREPELLRRYEWEIKDY